MLLMTVFILIELRKRNGSLSFSVLRDYLSVTFTDNERVLYFGSTLFDIFLWAIGIYALAYLPPLPSAVCLVGVLTVSAVLCWVITDYIFGGSE